MNMLILKGVLLSSVFVGIIGLWYDYNSTKKELMLANEKIKVLEKYKVDSEVSSSLNKENAIVFELLKKEEENLKVLENEEKIQVDINCIRIMQDIIY